MLNRRLTAFLVLLLGSLLLPLITGCEESSTFTSNQELALGERAGALYERENRGLDRERISSRVEAIGRRLGEEASSPYTYEARVVASVEPEAVAFPGGRLYVTRGMAELFNQDADALAWVLAHATAHLARGHVTRRLERELGYERALALLVGEPEAIGTAGALVELMRRRYSPQEEAEADRYALIYTHAAGFDPSAALYVLKRFQEIQRHRPSDAEIMYGAYAGENERLEAAQAFLEDQGWQGRYLQY